MNNTLKFRVWDKKHRTYEHDLAGAYLIDMLGDLIFIKEEDDNMDRVQGENFIVERCTGLTDKNGKLIYEGILYALTQSYLRMNPIEWCGTKDRKNLLVSESHLIVNISPGIRDLRICKVMSAKLSTM